ncbi:MAG: hypothetical protein WCJ31_15310 [Planctomycetia bacterium]
MRIEGASYQIWAKDSNGHAIPSGIHLRPFQEGSWYHHSCFHAHRWVK